MTLIFIQLPFILQNYHCDHGTGPADFIGRTSNITVNAAEDPVRHDEENCGTENHYEICTGNLQRSNGKEEQRQAE